MFLYLNLLFDHVDNKKNIDGTNYIESMNEFKTFSTSKLVEGIERFRNLFGDKDFLAK